jgi:hypothetical protein
MLREGNLVDFEDMLVLAADHLEAGRGDPGYDLILVDEFQDVSQARARLVRALLQRPERYLLAVGDDWQAINRFAGADISVMSDFEAWFGAGIRLELTTTFRCPQSVCDVAGRFVMRNPRQLRKAVRSVQPDPGPPVRLIRTQDQKASLAQWLEALAGSISSGSATPGKHGEVTVNVLGRYNFEREVLPARSPPGLRVYFRTIHGAKGLEADYIVIPGLVAGRYGFPSDMADDPVLDLVMAAPEHFPHAEERRLLYVALTRARREVVIMTRRGSESPFVEELRNDSNVEFIDEEAEEAAPTLPCEGCGDGVMVRRSGRWGEFLGCSTYPACTYTERLDIRPAPARPQSSERERGRGDLDDVSVVVSDNAGAGVRALRSRVAEAPLRWAGGAGAVEGRPRTAPPHTARVGPADGHDLTAPRGSVGTRGGTRVPDGTRAQLPRTAWLLALPVLALLALVASLYRWNPEVLEAFFRGLQSGRPTWFEIGSAGREPWLVNAAVLNVRDAPGMHGRIVAQLTAGQPVREVDVSGNWKQIVLSGSSQPLGWVYGPLLTKSPPDAP